MAIRPKRHLRTVAAPTASILDITSPHPKPPKKGLSLTRRLKAKTPDSVRLKLTLVSACVQLWRICVYLMRLLGHTVIYYLLLSRLQFPVSTVLSGSRDSGNTTREMGRHAWERASGETCKSCGQDQKSKILHTWQSLVWVLRARNLEHQSSVSTISSLEKACRLRGATS